MGLVFEIQVIINIKRTTRKILKACGHFSNTNQKIRFTEISESQTN